MTARFDLTGQRFGYWLVLERAACRTNGDTCHWLCECLSCGNARPVSAKSLRYGKSKSCASCAQKLRARRILAAKTMEQLQASWARRRVISRRKGAA